LLVRRYYSAVAPRLRIFSGRSAVLPGNSRNIFYVQWNYIERKAGYITDRRSTEWQRSGSDPGCARCQRCNSPASSCWWSNTEQDFLPGPYQRDRESERRLNPHHYIDQSNTTVATLTADFTDNLPLGVVVDNRPMPVPLYSGCSHPSLCRRDTAVTLSAG